MNIDCGIYEITQDDNGFYYVREQLEGRETTFRDADSVGAFITGELERLETEDDEEQP